MVNISNQVIPNRGLAPQAKASDVQILAAIDIGTNSVHMVVVAIEPSLPAFTIIAREKDTVRLGDRDRKTGKLTLAAMERAIAALKRCHDLAISLHADQIIAVATSAEYVDMMRKAGGIITEDTAMNNHAATIGLKLGIPVIVGVKDATKIIREGVTTRLRS